MSERESSAEDRLDANYRLIAILFLCVGGVNGAAAVQLLLNEGGTAFMVVSYVRQALLIITSFLCVFTAWKSLSSTRKYGRGCILVRDGFVFRSIMKAAVIAGLIAYLSLVFMHGFSDNSSLPAKFYLNLAMAIMALTFSVAYLVSSSVKADDGETGLV